ncbi:hypothetical protein CLV56_1859 [Mumia flava]|uniref:Uncharacterized protein n=1 Tax=Mumia flava TaxID=1348852 RepID=A0A0B2B6L6_9ACTN|nr:hypothetical protein [Mumia flava]PJJ57623.1 hypothetical protein CLV56_1859 [Mumia flava]
MSARHGDWHLLGYDEDPVPGSWTDIQDAGTHYTRVANKIESQVRRLRNLADDDEILKGEYADGLRESCRDTADDLERAQGRFETVGSQLGQWWEPVQTARTETWGALQDAEEAQRSLDQNPEPMPRPYGGPELTPDQQDARDRQQRHHDNAVGAMEAARGRARRALEPYDEKAESVAKAIRDASDDDMKDSRWDRFKNWIDDNAGWLKTVADIIGWVVTVVAVVALFCTPAGWVLALVAAIALVGVGIRFMLAASGNGSWADFAIDLVGVLTLGTGKIAASLAKVGRTATLRAIAPRAANLARGRAVTAAREAFTNARWFRKPGVWLTRSNPISRWMAGRTAYTTTKHAWLTKELPDVTRVETLLAGLDDGAAAMRKELAALRTQFPDLVSPMYSRSATAALRAAQVGTGVDALDKSLGGIPGVWDGVGPYGDLKDTTKYAPGGHLG